MRAMYNIHICGRIVKSCNSTSYCITKCKNISNYCLEYNNKEFNQFISQYPKKMKLQIFTRKKFVLKKDNKNIINKTWNILLRLLLLHSLDQGVTKHPDNHDVICFRLVKEI